MLSQINGSFTEVTLWIWFTNGYTWFWNIVPWFQTHWLYLQDVTQDFCKWVADLGGESNNIEESTIYSLFASGYETKPALSVPIHMVELTNVPPELRMSAAIPPEQQAEQKTQHSKKTTKKHWVSLKDTQYFFYRPVGW